MEHCRIFREAWKVESSRMGVDASAPIDIENLGTKSPCSTAGIFTWEHDQILVNIDRRLVSRTFIPCLQAAFETILPIFILNLHAATDDDG